MDLESLEEILARHPGKVDRRRSNTPLPWPDEWDRRTGFAWPLKSVEVAGRRNTAEESGSEEKEVEEKDWFEMSVPEGFEEESDSDGTGIPDEFVRQSMSPDPPPRREIDLEEAEDALLNTETKYLDAVDAQASQIELDRLHQHIKHGLLVSRRNFLSAVAALSSDATENTRLQWEAALRRHCKAHGYEWAEYPGELVGIEGKEWDTTEEWETWQKTKNNGEETVRPLKRHRSEEYWVGRKRQVVRSANSIISGESTSSEEEDEDVDHSALDTDSE